MLSHGLPKDTQDHQQLGSFCNSWLHLRQLELPLARRIHLRTYHNQVADALTRQEEGPVLSAWNLERKDFSKSSLPRWTGDGPVGPCYGMEWTMKTKPPPCSWG